MSSSPSSPTRLLTFMHAAGSVAAPPRPHAGRFPAPPRDRLAPGEAAPPVAAPPAPPAPPAEPKPDPAGDDVIDPDRESGLLHRILQIVIVAYSALLLGFVWLTKDLSIASLASDPVFAGYSVGVVLYLLSRFALSLAYRPKKDVGYRPSLSIIIPAFNEEECIAETIQSCLAVDYPAELLEVVVVNDGSTDGTWQRILEAKERYPRLRAIDLGRNYGKRGAMAEGVRRSGGEIICFVDSDSYLERDAAANLVAPFADEGVGAVVGHADVANAMHNWLTKMQQVRYYSAFRVIKGTESLLSGTVVCASGCCAAYRRDVVEPLLADWEFQTFLGRPATFGDDRALTNRVLRQRRVVYQSSARARTMVPTSMRVFLRQQLRWKKSWLRESLEVTRYFWRKNPIAALMTYASIIFPFLAPIIVTRAVLVRLAPGQEIGGLWFYLIGTYAMAMLYCLYYAFRRSNGLWHHGLTFVGIYMTTLAFQTYWAIATMRDTRWGTRSSTVKHEAIDTAAVTELSPAPGGAPPLTSPRPWAREPRRRVRRQAIVGLLLLPLSALPFVAYATKTDEGKLLWAKVHTSFSAPQLPVLPAGERAWIAAHAPSYRGAVASLVYHGLGSGSADDPLGRFSMTPQRFAEQIATLKEAGMNAVTAEDVARAYRGEAPLPENAFMISFDDGRTDAMLYADPILKDAGMSATMFVITGSAESRGIYYVAWDALREYAASGRWDIQSHTAALHHEHDSSTGRPLPALTSRMRDETVEEYRQRVRTDLRRASATIEREIGRAPVAFAYPFGAYGGEHDDRKSGPESATVVREAVAAEYDVAFNQDDQDDWTLSACGENTLGLRRLEVGNWTGRELLTRIAGAAAALPDGCTVPAGA